MNVTPQTFSICFRQRRKYADSCKAKPRMLLLLMKFFVMQ